MGVGGFSFRWVRVGVCVGGFSFNEGGPRPKSCAMPVMVPVENSLMSGASSVFLALSSGLFRKDGVAKRCRYVVETVNETFIAPALQAIEVPTGK